MTFPTRLQYTQGALILSVSRSVYTPDGALSSYVETLLIYLTSGKQTVMNDVFLRSAQGPWLTSVQKEDGRYILAEFDADTGAILWENTAVSNKYALHGYANSLYTIVPGIDFDKPYDGVYDPYRYWLTILDKEGSTNTIAVKGFDDFIGINNTYLFYKAYISEDINETCIALYRIPLANIMDEGVTGELFYYYQEPHPHPGTSRIYQ